MTRNVARRSVAVVIILIALAIVVPPFINVNRYRSKMTDALSRATGRNVSVGQVSLRLIPQPGFDMSDVEIGDDPAFSNEPILRSEQVTAYLRLTSLWRGRLEIAKLDLHYPTLNLVRGRDGHWNMEALLWRASRTQVAPTGQRHAEARPRFPYVEVDQGRVNFSFGHAKTVFSFTDADVALFSPSENRWRIRLEARPVRTDTNISDTGTVKADISFDRAEMLRDTQVHGKISWQEGQLGMITKLIYGRDRGWRGGLELDSEVSGSPAELHFTSAAAIHDFRRYDVNAGDPLTVAATCRGVASIPDYSMSGFDCQMPISPGTVTARGSFGPSASTYDISLAAENVSTNALVNVARRAKKNLPSDLSTTGTLNMAATFRKSSSDPASAVWSGDGTTSDVEVRTSLLRQPLKLRPLHIALQAPTQAPKQTPQSKKKPPKSGQKTLPYQFLSIAPFQVELGAKTPAIVDGRFAIDGYELGLSGAAEMEDLIGFARTIGVSVPSVTLRGPVTVDLNVSGAWRGLPEPVVDGTAKVTGGRAEIPGIAEQVVLAQSNVTLHGNELLLEAMQGQVGALKFTGWARLPRHCENDSSCGPLMDLQFDDLNLDVLNTLLNPNLKRQPWYKLFGSSKEESLLSKVYAVGRISAKRFDAGRIVGTRVFANFRLNSGQLLVSDLSANVLGGMHLGEWHADFRGATPSYSGTGQLTRVNVAQLGTLLKTTIGSGLLTTARYDIQMSGWNGQELAKSAQGTATFDWSAPSIRAFAANGKGPGKIEDFSGKLAYKDGVLNFEQGKLRTTNSIYSVTGTADGDKLALEVSSGAVAGYRVTGSPKAPEVAVVGVGAENSNQHPRTEASLKQ